ncbi:hypothetical protein, partial [Phocaeicola plebeius]
HPDGSQKCGRRRFLRKGESFFTGSSGWLRTGENVSGKELVSGNMNLNHRDDNFYSCNSKN